LLAPFVVWKNILIEDKLKDLGSLLFILNRTLKYNIFLLAAMLQTTFSSFFTGHPSSVILPFNAQTEILVLSQNKTQNVI